MPKEQEIKKNIQAIRQPIDLTNDRAVNPEDLFINFQQPIDQPQRLTEFDDFNFVTGHQFSFLNDEEEEERDLEDFRRMNEALDTLRVETSSLISANDPQEEIELNQWLNDLERILNERIQDNDSTSQSVSSPFTLFSHDAQVLREPAINLLQQPLEPESPMPRPYGPEISETPNKLQSQLHPTRRTVLMNMMPSSFFLPGGATNINFNSSQSLLGPITATSTTTTTTQPQNVLSSAEPEDRGTKRDESEIKSDDEDENPNQRSFKRAK